MLWSSNFHHVFPIIFFIALTRATSGINAEKFAFQEVFSGGACKRDPATKAKLCTPSVWGAVQAAIFDVIARRSVKADERNQLQLKTTDKTDASPYPNCTDAPPKQGSFSVSVSERYAADPKSGGSLISKANATSDFSFSFNTAYFPASGSGGKAVAEGLVVRVVECADNHHTCVGHATHPEWTNAGALAVVRADFPAAPGAVLSAEHVSLQNITWAGSAAPPHGGNTSLWGFADPRIAYSPTIEGGMYFLTYDNCTRNCYPHRSTLLSTTKDPFDPNGWTDHGSLLPGVYTGGASLLFRDIPPHYAFVGASSIA